MSIELNSSKINFNEKCQINSFKKKIQTLDNKIEVEERLPKTESASGEKNRP